ncbi:LCCL domain-containing protein [Azospirillum canadense]|uniref:LCCL domain-containing protein n=1 Tax=Azospirillum canadense TaxID=403962 RepID=UPI002227AEF5|nr:LCCL domain-containing protein [Azospirillum canadense]MCW2241613.1 outer membrane protein OmpA-like peptidoglycan-associated protein [Azospirillum canadense]
MIDSDVSVMSSDAVGMIPLLSSSPLDGGHGFDRGLWRCLMSVCRSCLLLLLLLAGSISVAHAEKRIALVVGISNYRHIPPLANTANDARDMATMLRETGFELIGGGPQLDPDKAGLENLIRDFGRRLSGDTVGLFYYSGHGVQMNGSNYLVPSQANVSSVADVKYELVDATYVLDEMSGAGNRLNIVILDACRNNPFSGRNLRGVAPGLSQVTAPAGTVIGYATQPGNVAYDGEGIHSPYSEALLEAMSLPGLDIFRMFNTVGLKVKTATGGRQQPWLAVSPIEGSFEFVPREAEVSAEPAAPPPTVNAAVSGPEPDRPLAVSPGPPATASPVTSPAATAKAMTMDICPDTFTAFRGTTAPLNCGCSPDALRASSNVYGSDVYADVSPICRAALHAGAVGKQGGEIIVTPREEPPFYPGVTRNGITSQSDRSKWGGAFSVASSIRPPKTPEAWTPAGMRMDICPDAFTAFRGTTAPLRCGCSPDALRVSSNVYGSDVYADVSPICRAALHAGAVGKQGGEIIVTPREEPPFYPGVTRNGITSQSDRSKWGGAFSVASSIRPPKTPEAWTPAGMRMDICPDAFTAFRGTTAPLNCGCSPDALRVSSNVYGSDVYADVSPICRAALHAGAVGKQGGEIIVTPREEPPLYPGVTRNGITSQSDRSKWGGAFSVAGLNPPATPPTAPQDLLDKAGRPVQAPIAETLKKTGHVQMYINFVTDSADLQPNAEPVLRDLLKALRGDPGLRLELVGHTDATGTAGHNQDLSERRALTVFTWLARNGIERDRLKASGHGRMEPIADNETAQGRALNRRVEAKALD